MTEYTFAVHINSGVKIEDVQDYKIQSTIFKNAIETMLRADPDFIGEQNTSRRECDFEIDMNDDMQLQARMCLMITSEEKLVVDKKKLKDCIGNGCVITKKLVSSKKPVAVTPPSTP